MSASLLMIQPPSTARSGNLLSSVVAFKMFLIRGPPLTQPGTEEYFSQSWRFISVGSYVALSSVSFSDLSVDVGESVNANIASKNPTNASIALNTDFIYSDGGQIVSINNASGTFTGLKTGEKTINAVHKSIEGISSNFQITVNPIASSYTFMTLNTNYDDSFLSGEHIWYKFVPTETGVYVFESQGSSDLIGNLYQGDTQIATNDDDGNGLNFKICIQLTEGIEYRLQVKGYSEYTTGTFKVSVKVGWPEVNAPSIKSRDEWGARDVEIERLVERNRAPERIIFHHSADKFNSTDIDVTINEIKRIQNLHMDTKNKCDIAYHFIIDPEGRIWQGANIDNYERGHTTNYFDDIGVLVLGDFESRVANLWMPNTLNQKQKEAMFNLSKWLCFEYDLLLVNSGESMAPVSTHRIAYSGTVCPGSNLADWIENDLCNDIRNWLTTEQ
ncbi:MAG: hypothetical protein DBX40_00345 [Clostridiales bacterium]|nr:MAG: hypothetical protein DBX40_00345 [Clostridiales bacterium]